MKTGRKLQLPAWFRGTSSLTVGSALNAVFMTILVVTVAREGGVEDASLWFLGQAIATPIAFVSSLRLREQLPAEHPSSIVFRIRRVCKVSLIGFALGLVVFALVATTFGEFAAYLSILIANLSQGFLGAWQGSKIQSGSFFSVAASDAILGLVAVSAVSGSYVAGYGLTLGVALTAFGWVLIAVPLSGAMMLRSPSQTPVAVTLKEDLAIGFGSMMQLAQISAIRLLVGIFGGAAALSSFGIGSYLIRTGVIFVSALRSALSSNLLRALGTHGSQVLLSKFLRWATVFIALGSVSALLLAEPATVLLNAVFTERVAPSSSLTLRLIWSALPLYVGLLLSQIAIALGQRKIVLNASVVGLVVAVTVGLLVADDETGVGGATALLAANSAWLAALIVLCLNSQASSSDALDVEAAGPTG